MSLTEFISVVKNIEITGSHDSNWHSRAQIDYLAEYPENGDEFISELLEYFPEIYREVDQSHLKKFRSAIDQFIKDSNPEIESEIPSFTYTL